MKHEITSLHLQQFRSYDDFAVELSPTVNIVVGPNASGKTNLLEAVLLLSGGSSYRASTGDVVMHGKEWARVEAQLTNTARSLSIEMIGDSPKKRFTINDVHRQRLRFEDILPVVLFEPENMRLLTGSPDMRREFLDDILTLIDPVFGSTKKHYIRTLAQRNGLLKMHKSITDSQLFVWNIRLSELGGYIATARQKLVTDLDEALSDLYSKIAAKPVVAHIRYQSAISFDSYETTLLRLLENNIAKDLERGFTAYGPHRDDFSIELSGTAAKLSASRGETRTLLLSLKLLEVRMLQQKRSAPPLILLDDVFSELDGSRRKALTTYLQDYQTIITTTDADVIIKDFAQHANTISL